MASAYLPLHHLNKIFHREAPSVLKPSEDGRILFPQDQETPLGRPFRRMEILANATHGAVGILVDENQKYHEADLIKADLEAVGREVIIGSTNDITRVGGNAFLNNTRISSTYNKFRLFGAQHQWSEQAFARYWPFLETVRRSDLHLVNNFAAMTISEDKSIFGAMRLTARDMKASAAIGATDTVRFDGASGFDFDSGFGLLDAAAALLITRGLGL